MALPGWPRKSAASAKGRGRRDAIDGLEFFMPAAIT
jgi:hypothetical protein